MRDSDNTRSAIRNELLRMEEDCTYSGKAHFNACARWNWWHYFFGIPAVVLAALASGAFFKDYSIVAGVLTSVVAIMTALMTFLKPAERAAGHKNSGDQYLALRNDARVFRTIQLDRTETQEAVAMVSSLTTRRNELNAASTPASKGDFQIARKGIEEGEARHEVDK